MDKKYSDIRKSSVLGILGNLFLLIIKGIVSFISGSKAMLADTFNSASDVISSYITYIGNKISSQKADDDHNLGHGKAEYIYSLLISIIMFLLAFSVIKSSLISLITKEKFTFSIWLIIICVITIIVKFMLFIYTHKMYKKYNNILIKANSKDHFNDCIITTSSLISCLLGKIGFYFVDGILGIIIGLWIAINAIKIFIESYDVLMDKSLDEQKKTEVLNLIKKHPEVLKTNHFNSTPVGYQYQISCTIFVDGNLSTFESHEIANKLEKEIDKAFPEIYLTVIHVNPMKVEKTKK